MNIDLAVALTSDMLMTVLTVALPILGVAMGVGGAVLAVAHDGAVVGHGCGAEGRGAGGKRPAGVWPAGDAVFMMVEAVSRSRGSSDQPFT